MADPTGNADYVAADDLATVAPTLVTNHDIAQRYPWRVRCSGCGWVDHFDMRETAQSWADRHNARTTSWPHDAKVSPRD